MSIINPKVSIILISYNEADYLKTAIESVLQQDYENIELIIGDDGSSDGSIEIMKEYFDRYPDKISYFVMSRDEEISNIIPSFRVSNVIRKEWKLL